MGILKMLKKIDIYGYQVNFNFDKKGTQYPSLIGGLFTLCIIGLMGYLALYNFYLMFTY